MVNSIMDNWKFQHECLLHLSSCPTVSWANRHSGNDEIKWLNQPRSSQVKIMLQLSISQWLQILYGISCSLLVTSFPGLIHCTLLVISTCDTHTPILHKFLLFFPESDGCVTTIFYYTLANFLHFPHPRQLFCTDCTTLCGLLTSI